MMKTQDCYYLGYISKTIGFEGSLLAFFEVSDPSLYQDLEAVFVLIEGKLVPFFIDDISIRKKNKEVILDLEDIGTTEQARFLCDRKIYLHRRHLKHNLPLKKMDYKDLTGFQVLDQNKATLGIIDQVLDYPGNPVFSIRKGKKEILLPVAEEFLSDINPEKKQITITPPEGLLDLYV